MRRSDVSRYLIPFNFLWNKTHSIGSTLMFFFDFGLRYNWKHINSYEFFIWKLKCLYTFQCFAIYVTNTNFQESKQLGDDHLHINNRRIVFSLHSLLLDICPYIMSALIKFSNKAKPKFLAFSEKFHDGNTNKLFFLFIEYEIRKH